MKADLDWKHEDLKEEPSQSENMYQLYSSDFSDNGPCLRGCFGLQFTILDGVTDVME